MRRSSERLELWAGPECTVARVGDRYVDQTELTGHGARLSDLDLFASLGISALRYPVLWERTSSWRWPDERLHRLRELGIRPIVGLVHHGSGPPDTSLLDPAFAERLAEFAHAVAERYPWVTDWTPVNEPLTTARFSALYGHWYPHARDALSFARALLVECRAVARAMDAIRAVVPGARLVQTEDLGKTHSTAALAYQAEYENERRWLSFDLLTGRLDPDGVVARWLGTIGVGHDELDWFREHPCPPDVLGINHYLSSERFLDERLERYPEESRGGNGRDAYADVLAHRVLARGADGPGALLREAWARYGIPLAVTECHNGCTREEQLRWLDEVWRAALAARGAGARVEAVTLWSLLGAVGWDTLLVGERGAYEPGVFDLRAPRPRPTALAAMARGLATAGWQHPVVESPGWWRRPERLWYPPVGEPVERRNGKAAQPLVITGRTGTLGSAFARVCTDRGLEHRLLGRSAMDIADGSSVARVLDDLRPWAVVNAAGYVRVDDAEEDEARCRRENADGPAVLAAACAERGIGLVTYSSDLVFDGAKGAPYVEADDPAPLNVYGRTKADAEERVRRALPDALVVRTSAFFGPWDEWNFVTLARRGTIRVAAADHSVSPTYVPDLVHATLDLLIDGESGVWHLANAGSVTWAELATLAGADVDPVPAETLGWRAPRPRSSVLTSERGWLLPSLEDALARYLREAA